MSRATSAGSEAGRGSNAGCGHVMPASAASNYCPRYTAFGRSHGGHAAYVEVPARFLAQGNLVNLPEGVSTARPSC
jgi:hypothetical protein